MRDEIIILIVGFGQNYKKKVLSAKCVQISQSVPIHLSNHKGKYPKVV